MVHFQVEMSHTDLLLVRSTLLLQINIICTKHTRGSKVKGYVIIYLESIMASYGKEKLRLMNHLHILSQKVLKLNTCLN